MTTAGEKTRVSPPRPDMGGRRLPFDLSRPGRKGVLLPPLDVPPAPPLPSRFLRSRLNLPELAQNQVIRYFLALSRLNYSADTGFSPPRARPRRGGGACPPCPRSRRPWPISPAWTP